MDSAQIVIFVFVTTIIDKMGKGTHFFGQSVYGQLIKCLNKDKIVEMSRNHGGERYIKSFDGWHQSAYRQQTRTCLAMSGSPTQPRMTVSCLRRACTQMERLLPWTGRT